MPDTGLLALSVVSLLVGTLLVLAPRKLTECNAWLNRSLGKVDAWLVRHRYVMALAAFGAGYAFFKLALLVPTLRLLGS